VVIFWGKLRIFMDTDNKKNVLLSYEEVTEYWTSLGAGPEDVEIMLAFQRPSILLKAHALYETLGKMRDKSESELTAIIKDANPSPELILYLLEKAEFSVKEDLAKEKRKKFEPIRLKGQVANRRKAIENDKLILKTNLDLLNHPTTCRWSLDKRSEFIANLCFKQLNGKPYAWQTIKNKIKGT
jgi:hypothetical protein